MKSLPTKFFGPSGIPCVFSVDDSGNTVIGYLHKQLSNYSFIVTDGTTTKKAHFVQNPEDVVDLTHLPNNSFTITITPFGQDVEHISYLTYDKCKTIEGNGYYWHNNSPTEKLAGITTPIIRMETFFRLLEDGTKWLLETGDKWLLQTAPPYILLETTGYLMLENGGKIELEGLAS